MNQNDKNKFEKFGMTHNQLQELRSFLVERQVDNMSTKDLVAYVMDDLDRFYDKMDDIQFLDEASDYWEDHFSDVVDEVEDYMKCDLKKDRRFESENDFGHIGTRDLD